MTAHNEVVPMEKDSVWGRLTIVAQSDDFYIYKDRRGITHRIAMFICTCECDRTITAQGRAIRSGNTRSCRFCNRHATKIQRYRNHAVKRDWHGRFVRWIKIENK